MPKSLKIVFLCLLLIVLFVLVVLSARGCENQSNNSSVDDTRTEEPATTPSDDGTTDKGTTDSDESKVSVDVSGVWKATGKDDEVSSTWYFNSGKLVVNYVYNFSYAVAENKESNGYTIVTIKNGEGKEHALLLKENGSNLDGITVEGDAYNQFLADGTVPDGQVIEFALQQNAWGSMDDAIDFWERTFKNADNEASKDIAWENYRRDLWSLVEDETSGNTITLHFTNISGAGGSYDQFVKNGENTIITRFDGNAMYPDNPSIRYTVRNSDYKVMKTEELWKQE